MIHMRCKQVPRHMWLKKYQKRLINHLNKHPIDLATGHPVLDKIIYLLLGLRSSQ